MLSDEAFTAVKLLLKYGSVDDSSLVEIVAAKDELRSLKLLDLLLSKQPSLLIRRVNSAQDTIAHLMAARDKRLLMQHVLRVCDDDSLVELKNLHSQNIYDVAKENCHVEICLLILRRQNCPLEKVTEPLQELAKLPPEDFEHIDVTEEIQVESSAFNEVLIHIDLKGAPPKFEFLLQFINYLLTKPTGRHVITGFLVEFEDMFPYRDNLHALRSDTVPAYSVE